MIARLLYAAVALCLLGTWPERAANRPAPALQVAATARADRPEAAAARPVPRPPDFAIPRIER